MQEERRRMQARVNQYSINFDTGDSGEGDIGSGSESGGFDDVTASATPTSDFTTFKYPEDYSDLRRLQTQSQSQSQDSSNAQSQDSVVSVDSDTFALRSTDVADVGRQLRIQQCIQNENNKDKINEYGFRYCGVPEGGLRSSLFTPKQLL